MDIKKRQHQEALQSGEQELFNVLHYYHRYRHAWKVGTLLVTGYTLWKYHDGATETDWADARVLQDFRNTWSGQRLTNLPLATRQQLNSIAYRITTERCKIVKDQDIEPQRPKTWTALKKSGWEETLFLTEPDILFLRTALGNDVAEIVFLYLIGPVLPNHRRCAALGIDKKRCCRCRYQWFGAPGGTFGERNQDFFFYDFCAFQLTVSAKETVACV